MERSSRSDRGSGRGDSGRGGYQYRPRSSEEAKKRADAGGSNFDSYVKETIKLFTPRGGDNIIRIMPPTWKDAAHFGYDIYLHYNIGSDNSAYLCPDKMAGKPCPICEERARAEKAGDADYASKLKPNKRVLVWMIDRNEAKDGPIMWSMPWTIDRDILKISIDKSTGEMLPIDHPYEGFDVEFERKGTGTKTEYIGIAIARRSSDLGSDRWLDFVQDNPIPDQLIIQDYDYLAKVFSGASAAAEEAPPPRASLRDDSPRGSDRSRSREPEPDWDSIHKMTFDQMADLIEAKGLNIDPQKSKDDEDLADWICEELKVEKTTSRSEAAPARRAIPPADPAPPAEESHRDRLRRMRGD